jgi:hypothetical protein
MEQINFSEFIAPEVQNKRKENALPPKVQEFDNLKYRRAETEKGGKPKSVQGGFHLAKKLIADLGLESNALRHFVHPKDKTIVLVGTVADKDGAYMKKREGKKKGDTFKSDNLEAALAAAGIIDLNVVGDNQFIDLVKVGENQTIQGFSVLTVYKAAKGTKKVTETPAEKKVEDKVVAAAPAAPASAPAADAVAAAPAPAAAPVTAATAQDDWT